MENNKKIKVHIADDHQILIDGIVAVLKNEENIDVAGHSLNGRLVIDWLNENKADVLVLDINMPEVDGLEVLRYLKKNKLELPTIILSSYDDVKLVKEVLKMGADGFLAKKCAGENIVEAINSVYNGDQYFSNEVQKDLVAAAVGKTIRKKVHQDGVFSSSLTDRELEVLQLISIEMSTKEIAERLNISTSTVDTYRKNLLQKTKAKNSVGLAMYAVRNKLL
ncbi:response regulator [Flavicella marina]|uniref:response regulator n=1 Tax=Flavicella marina TaxID=1475951 RepID=UPI001265952B|nr:response regulator transcription factor [Flavicella marina]